MLSLSELVRIYVCLAPTDLRKSFDSLAALVQDGLTLYYRRLEHHLHLLLKRLYGSTSEKFDPRQGVRISRQTMDGWWLETAEFLRPLYSSAVGVVRASHVLHTDDTSVKIRDAWRKLKHTGRFWPYVGDPLHPLTVFDDTTTHQRDGPAAFLKDYRGYLQSVYPDDGWLDIDNKIASYYASFGG